MNVLVTGAAGFIGSHLAERLCARGDRVTGLDNFDGFYPREVKQRNVAGLGTQPGFSLIEGDLRDPLAIDRAFAAAEATGPIDAVVHLAALAGVRPSLEDPVRYAEVNVTGTVRLLESCHRRRVRNVIFASSSSVYGAFSQVPFREADVCAHPVSPYAATKRSGELVAFTAHHLHGLNLTCLRFFTVYGPRQRPDLAIHKFTRLISAGLPIQLYGDGSTSRDYTWVDDIIDGVVASIEQQRRDAQPQYRIYNLGGSQTTPLRELVDRISAALGKSPSIEWKPEQPGDMNRTLADVTLSRRDLGYAPRVSIEDGIPRFVDWYRRESR